MYPIEVIMVQLLLRPKWKTEPPAKTFGHGKSNEYLGMSPCLRFSPIWKLLFKNTLGKKYLGNCYTKR